MKKQYPTFIDISAEQVDEMYVSAGKIGMQICITPENLVKAAKAQIVSLT